MVTGTGRGGDGDPVAVVPAGGSTLVDFISFWVW